MLKIAIGKFEFNEKEAREVYKELAKIFKNVTGNDTEHDTKHVPKFDLTWPNEDHQYKVACNIVEKAPYYTWNSTNNLDFSYGELNE